MSFNVSGYNISDIYIGDGKIDKVFVGEDLVYSSGPEFYDYFGFQVDDPTQVSTIALNNIVTAGTDKSKLADYVDPILYYSYDGQTWNSYTLNTALSIGGNNPSTVYMKGDNLKRWYQYYVDDNSNYYTVQNTFSITGGTVSAIGNIMALRYSNPTPSDIIPCDYAFYMLFDNCTLLTTAPQLPAPTLASNCYAYMFEGCTSMTKAPELPATTLTDWCYFLMFNSCTSLTEAPELPATTLANRCYNSMFRGCTSLTEAPELPATTLATYCYNSMFNSCTSLTEAPELPATTLANNCYNYMFDGCTSLTEAPELPATTLANNCYNYMFRGCISLTTPPELPATTLTDNCYPSMFQGCTSITTAPELPATTLTTSCYASMFQGCTSLTTPPELPATTLAGFCYNLMFQGCTSLTYLPELPATTLTDWCYADMFSQYQGADGIKANGTSSPPCIYPYRIPSSGDGTAGSKSLNNMFVSISGDTGYSPNINTTFYTAIPMAT